MENWGPAANLLTRIYGPRRGQEALSRIRHLLADMVANPLSAAPVYPDEKEVILITYADSVRHPDQAPLQTLRAFARKRLEGVVSTIHFLPFFPYSSDDGFAVVDYRRIDPTLGGWEDVRAFAPDFRLMFDWVVNHISAQSPWFEAYLHDRPGYAQLAIEVDPGQDLSLVTRPRSLPLLTPFTKAGGRVVHLWTTFSADQIDLNFASIDVLVRMIDVMATYIRNGAAILRLDAIAYLWKQTGTPCIHLPQTHWMVKLFRAILDVVAPHVILITETNVPHEENIRYFGEGGDEAQMVYNFTLPPLLLHCFLQEDVSALRRWAGILDLPHPRTAFFNFSASHDGIGVRPLEGIVAAADIAHLVRSVKANGGRVSYRRNRDGTESPYELNITYVDALRGEGAGGDERHARRFLASQSIALALPGVPAIYIHSLLGSRNWREGVRLTGRARSINREKLDARRLAPEMENPGTFRSRVFSSFTHMIRVRRRQPAFHPKAGFAIPDLSPRVFAIARNGGGQRLLALTNISSQPVTVDAGTYMGGACCDLLSGQIVFSGHVALAPHGILWLTPV